MLLRLLSSVERFRAADGSVYLLRPGAGHDLAIRDADAAHLELLERLERPTSPAALSDLEDRLDLEAALGMLREHGLLEDLTDDALLGAGDRERYDRQLAYFSELGAPSRGACQLRLRDSTVTIIGAGGLGTWAALGLACAGVGALRLVDDDTVAPSNLNRQVLYTPADIGRPKVEAAAEALSRFNPAVAVDPVPRRVRSEADVAEVIAGSDAVVAVADWPPFEIGGWINGACMKAGIPWIAGSQFPPLVRVGPTYVRGQTGCLACQEARWRAEHPLIGEVEAAQRMGGEVAATFGPACELIGAVISSDLVHLLSGAAAPATLGASLLIDLRTLAVEREAVPRSPDCPVCTRP